MKKSLRDLAARRARDNRYRALLNRYLWPWLGGLLLLVTGLAVAALRIAGTVPAPLLVSLCAVYVTGTVLAYQRAQHRARREVASENDLDAYEPPEDLL
ncbi:hypothetical protein [Pseudohaliea rubra]|uniref:Transmembrane protein n=1 Tax=Pseudohaliea rubra DSM 19751 TaxID=1265313 RepID=A0A095VVR8_9GAMM|nr:hypothetical protein [Pseudohaliea rubra]KGE05093.1 hypothetical protein HRUBRA_00295 [Pseudohaliea rubra DSM 19751]